MPLFWKYCDYGSDNYAHSNPIKTFISDVNLHLRPTFQTLWGLSFKHFTKTCFLAATKA